MPIGQVLLDDETIVVLDALNTLVSLVLKLSLFLLRYKVLKVRLVRLELLGKAMNHSRPP
jgi:hypothetical protein